MAKKSRRKGRSAAFMRSINPFLKSRSTRRGQKRMAKKRRTHSFKRGSSVGAMAVLIGGGVYGAARSKLSDAIAPLTSKIPLGSIADEAALFGLGYLAARNIRNPLVKSVANACMVVEAARMGEAMITGTAFGNASSNGAAVSTFSTLG